MTTGAAEVDAFSQAVDGTLVFAVVQREGLIRRSALDPSTLRRSSEGDGNFVNVYLPRAGATLWTTEVRERTDLWMFQPSLER